MQNQEMKFLAPLILKKSDYKPAEDEINRLFYEVIFKRLIEILKIPDKEVNISKEIKNSDDPLATAIRKGVIYFENDRFFGQFNSKTSKALREIGASFNLKSKTWSYSGALPANIQIASAAADAE